METLLKKFKKMTTVQLSFKVEKLVGEEQEACLIVLEARGVDISKWEVKQPEIENKPEIEFTQTKVGDGVVYEMIPENLTKEEKKVLDKAEKEYKKEMIEKKVIETPKTETKTKSTVPPLTEEQVEFVNSSIDSYKKGELTKKNLVISWMEFRITKQQVDKFVDSTVVNWSYAYPIYKSYGK